MPHITLPDGLPGILGLLAYRPETARPLNELAEALLVGPSPLGRAERELIAVHVSRGNDCDFCALSHGAVARQLLGDSEEAEAPLETPPSHKLRCLLAVAEAVRLGGKSLTDAQVAAARAAGASDLELHDTVLIAAAFCMFNRYVDGLATTTPQGARAYAGIGKLLAERGYLAAFASSLARS